MLRRLYHDQPESFAFTAENQAWADAQVTKFPDGRQASAIVPLLWRAQEQEGWLSRPAIESIAKMLDLAYIRALEVATFYFMFQLQPVGSVAHVQVCGTTSCMICGAEDLISVCRDKIAAEPYALSDDGKFSWEEVECLGACANAPMAQIGKDYYEDLTVETFERLLDDMADGRVPTPGSQTGRYASEPADGLTSLKVEKRDRLAANASVALAEDIGDTLKRIDGTEVPLTAPWRRIDDEPDPTRPIEDDADRSEGHAADETGVSKQESPETEAGRPEPSDPPERSNPLDAAEGAKDKRPGPAEELDRPSDARDDVGTKPETLSAAREGEPDDLKRIKGVGPKLEEALNDLGIYHFAQVASWDASNIAWIEENMIGFKGRVERDAWISQAKTLAEGGDTEFSGRVDKGEVY